MDQPWPPTLLWQGDSHRNQRALTSLGSPAPTTLGESGPTLVTQPGKVNGTCSPKDPTSPPGLCFPPSPAPQRRPWLCTSLAPSCFSRDLPSTTPEAPVLTPNTPAPSLQTPTGRGATDHPLLFEWQHYSFILACLPCLLFLTCQILPAVQEKRLSLDPFFLLPLQPFSRAASSPPHKLSLPSPLLKCSTLALKGSPLTAILQTLSSRQPRPYWVTFPASSPSCPREDSALGSPGRLGVPRHTLETPASRPLLLCSPLPHCRGFRASFMKTLWAPPSSQHLQLLLSPSSPPPGLLPLPALNLHFSMFLILFPLDHELFVCLS